MAPKRILAPVDFSPGSEAAVDYALFLVRALGGHVTLLHVHDRPSQMGQIVPGADHAADEQAIQKAALARLGRLRALLGQELDLINAAVETGDPTDAIVALAQSGNFDLIVMGTHARAGIDRVLMGSVAEGVVRRAPIPVLTIHLPHDYRSG